MFVINDHISSNKKIGGTFRAICNTENHKKKFSLWNFQNTYLAYIYEVLLRLDRSNW